MKNKLTVPTKTVDMINPPILEKSIRLEHKDWIHTARVDITLTKKWGINYENGVPWFFDVLSIVGYIKEKNTTVAFWQCFEEMKEIFSGNPSVAEFCNVWEEYQNNELTPWTKNQMEALNDFNNPKERTMRAQGNINIKNPSNLNVAKKYLESLGLLEDNGMVYWDRWLVKPIPEEIVGYIKFDGIMGVKNYTSRNTYE